MSKKDLNEKEADNSINSPPPPAQEQDKENIQDIIVQNVLH